ncbi:hypothetical protein [Paenarthrobacter nicotinovorans]|jgi:hypothetical protein|uniref:hypothetical protein n=1 Tax=Paenarthrobacter nicotinovorans TaxID=29320 RepID=UPI0005804A23|nr:hypothetical protein ANMWB30_08780 [Arthrobacter sp. MWB30]
MSTFLERFAAATDEEGLRSGWSPAAYLEAWAAFTEDCEKGYQGNIYEYENDISVRDVIERALTSLGPAEDAAVAVFADAVAESDARFAAVLNSGPVMRDEAVPWWRRRLPVSGGREFAAEARQHFSVTLSPVEA